MNNQFTFTKENMLSIAKGAGVAVVGALLTYVAQYVSNTDFGQWTPIVVAIAGILVNAGRKWVSNE